MRYERFRAAQGPEEILCYCDVDENLTPGVRYGPVVRDVFLIECCTGGYGSVIINGREFGISPGTVYALLPGDVIIHTADEKEPRRGAWCAIDGERVKEAIRDAGISSGAPFIYGECAREVTAIVQNMVEMRRDSDGGAEFRRTGLVYALIGAILRSKSSPHANLWVQRAVGIMRARYSTGITTAEIARELGLDRSYFSTLFKRTTGRAPSEYLEILRVTKADELIRERGFSIGRAAEAVGLDSRNFARLFKRHAGACPSELKRKRADRPTLTIDED